MSAPSDPSSSSSFGRRSETMEDGGGEEENYSRRWKAHPRIFRPLGSWRATINKSCVNFSCESKRRGGEGGRGRRGARDEGERAREGGGGGIAGGHRTTYGPLNPDHDRQAPSSLGDLPGPHPPLLPALSAPTEKGGGGSLRSPRDLGNHEATNSRNFYPARMTTGSRRRPRTLVLPPLGRYFQLFRPSEGSPQRKISAAGSSRRESSRQPIAHLLQFR